MSSKHYDIAIIGGSLTAAIAAALLAKQGSKVLFLRNQEAKAPAWFHSSIFLERLLGILGGRSCFVAPHPIQVISRQSRVTLSNDVSLEEELNREFGTTSPAVHKWLTELSRQGTLLEELLCENGGLPWPSLKASARFKLLCIRRKINLAEIEKPVTKALAGFEGPAKEFLTVLLQGLSLRNIEDLSYSRAAMLWTQALRPENLKEPDFSEMLNKRFEQFHGAKAQLDDLAALDFDGSNWVGGHFKSGGRFTAKTFLLGDRNWLSLFNKHRTITAMNIYAPSIRQTSDLTGQLSPLMGDRIMCGGPLPLRMAIKDHDQERKGLILSTPGATEIEIRQQLEPALPFAKYQLNDIAVADTTVRESGKVESNLLVVTADPYRRKPVLRRQDSLVAGDGCRRCCHAGMDAA